MKRPTTIHSEGTSVLQHPALQHPALLNSYTARSSTEQNRGNQQSGYHSRKTPAMPIPTVATAANSVNSSESHSLDDSFQNVNPWPWMLLLPKKQEGKEEATTPNSLPVRLNQKDYNPRRRRSFQDTREDEREGRFVNVTPEDTMLRQSQEVLIDGISKLKIDEQEGSRMLQSPVGYYEQIFSSETSGYEPASWSAVSPNGFEYSCYDAEDVVRHHMFRGHSAQSVQKQQPASAVYSPSHRSRVSVDGDLLQRNQVGVSTSLGSRKDESVERESHGSNLNKKRNMTQGRKEQRRRAMVRRAMRHLLEWPLDKQEKCNRNYGLLIIDVPGINKTTSYVLPCKEVRKLCTCNDCAAIQGSEDSDSEMMQSVSGVLLQSEIRAREINHYAEDGNSSVGVWIKWTDGHVSQHSYAELVSLHNQILNVSSQ